MKGFEAELKQQKDRSRSSTAIAAGDWVVLRDDDEQEFIGYTHTEAKVKIVKYREVTAKGKKQIQLVFNLTPFYAESGGQVGDTGIIKSADETIHILDTKKEHGLIIHFANQLPKNLKDNFQAIVNQSRRTAIMANHSATHLLHAALRKVLGEHVEQKGSLVAPDYLRFDFSHFSKIEPEQLKEIETIVNQKIIDNIQSSIVEMPIEDAQKLGAMALFGEKYGDVVRVVTFDKDYSIELCGGTHVEATGSIGFFKVVSESAVAAGVRRIEAISSIAAFNYISEELELLNEVKAKVKSGKDVLKGIEQLQTENTEIQKQLDQFRKEKAKAIKSALLNSIEETSFGRRIVSEVDLDQPELVKTISFELKNQFPDILLILGHVSKGKPMVTVSLGNDLVEKDWNAVKIIKGVASHIQGGGGGQPFFATAGGKNLQGLSAALEQARAIENPL